MAQALAGVATLLASCSNDAPAHPGEPLGDDDIASVEQALAEGRQVTITPWQGSGTSRAPTGPQVVDLTGPKLDTRIWQPLSSACIADMLKLYEGTSNCVTATSSSTCGSKTVPPGSFPYTASASTLHAVLYACMGHHALAIAEATKQYYFSWTSASVGRVSAEPPPSSDVISATVPPSSSSDRASWALLAVDLFRDAAISGTMTLETCRSTDLLATCSIGGGTKQIDFAGYVSANMLDGVTSSLEAAEKAAKYLHASAQAKRGGSSDGGYTRSLLWRDPYDSLLRAASAYVKVPTSLYNSKDASGVTISGNYPVVTAVAQTDADRRAENLIREHRIDPRQDATSIADGILTSLNAAYGSAYPTTGGLAFFAAEGISEQDFARAAKRLEQGAKVLGRPIKPYQDDGVSRVWGTEKASTPVNPWYLYAITETAEWPGALEDSPSVAYARRGVFHALDYVVRSMEAISAQSHSARTKKMFKSAEAFARTYVGGRMNLTVGGVDAVTSARLRIVEYGAQPHTLGATSGEQSALRTEYGERYDIWWGEEGLLCALEGLDRSGQPCDGSSLKMKEDIVFWLDAANPDMRYPMFEIGPTSSPDGKTPYVSEQGTPLAPRFYVTKRVSVTGADGREQVQNVLLGGFAVHPPGTTNRVRFYTPISSGLADALQNTLAVDPLQPDETSQLCGKNGLARNVKVGLEDELLQAQGVNASNTIEESWAYYLGLAETAATEADQIGDELVQRGLEMDMRAEEAREQLEDLCGGVINVGDLRDRVINNAGGDLTAFLELAENQKDESLVQLRQCLGIEATTNATLGSNAVCYWRVGDLPPCTCPAEGDPAHRACPKRKLSPEDAKLYGGNGTGLRTSSCVAPILGENSPSQESCAKLFVKPEPGASNALTFHVVSDRLALVPQLTDDDGSREYPCEALARRRESEAADSHLPTAGIDEGWGWTQSSLRDIATRIGVDRGDLNFVSITRDGIPWLITEGASPSAMEPNAWAASSVFPCTPLTGVDFCKSKRSVFCSLSCNASSGDDALMIKGRQEVGERLARAVEVMRQVSGSTLDGVEVATKSLARCIGRLDDGDELELFDERTCFGDSYSASFVTLRNIELERARNEWGSHWACSTRSLQEASEDSGNIRCNGSNLGLAHGDHPYDEDKLWSYLGTGTKREHPTYVDFRSTCINRVLTTNDASSHGVPTLPATVLNRLPGSCETFSNEMLFINAGSLISWPTASAFELTRFWTDRISSEIRGGYAAKESERRTLLREPMLNDGEEVAAGQGELRRTWPALSNYRREELLDALELACYARHAGPTASCEDAGLNASANIDGVAGLRRVAALIECRANQMNRAASSMTILDAPTSLVRQLGTSGAANIYPTFAGSYAQSVSKLLDALMRISSLMIDTAESARGASYGLLTLESRLQEAKYRKKSAVENATAKLQALDFECSSATAAAEHAVSNAIASAGIGLQAAISGGGIGALGSAAVNYDNADFGMEQARTKCSQTSGQKVHAEMLGYLEEQQIDEQVKQSVMDAADAMLKRHAALERTWKALLAAYGDAQAAAAELASQRNAAKRAAAKLLMLDNDDVGHEFQVNSAMRARMNTLRVRYERARDYAIRMAYLARRAIEQKIGMNLSEMAEDVGWVPAPKTWADSVCALEGINYKEIRDAEKQDEAAGPDGEYDYANEYVGDYVTKLREFMTSYVNNYVSHDDDDVVLVSLRDDLIGVRDTSCDVPVANELLQSYLATEGAPLGALDADASGLESEDVWGRCNAQGVCVEVSKTQETPFVPYGRDAMGNPIVVEDAAAATDLPQWGSLGNVVRAARLTAAFTSSAEAVGSGGTATDGPTPTAPPLNRFVWYRADACAETGTGLGSCTDLSGNNRTATAYVPSKVRKQDSGIGGQPSLEFIAGSGSWMLTPAATARTDRFTVSWVFRVAPSRQVLLLNWSATNPDGTVPFAAFYSNQLNAISRQAMFSYGADYRASSTLPKAAGFARAPNAPEARPEVGAVYTLVADGPRGSRIYIDGHLVSGSAYPVPPIPLGGSLFNNNGPSDSAYLAELVQYDRVLSDNELTTLHAYFAGRYGTYADTPYARIEADDLMRVAASGGTSDVSGFTRSTDMVFDSILGHAYGTYGPNAPSTAPTGLSAFSPAGSAHYALNFGGDDALSMGAYATTCDLPNGGTPGSCTSNSISTLAKDSLLTLVLRADQAGGHGLWWAALAEGGRIQLDANLTTGAVGVARADINNVYTYYSSAAATVAVGQPFVLSLRGSQANDRFDVFVNGEWKFSAPGFAHFGNAGIGGDGRGGYLKGAIAEYQMHMRPFTDEQVLALHAQLGATYGISVPNEVGGSNGPAPGSSGAAPVYHQWTNLANGTYVLSWFEQARDGISEPYLTPSLESGTGARITFTPGTGSPLVMGQERWLAPGWVRHWGTFRASGDVSVGWEVPTSTEVPGGVLFAAPQLERVEGADAMSIGPSGYVPTDDDYLSPIGVCDDRSGDIFRRDYWQHGCEVYCPSNTTDCADKVLDPSKLPKRCFHELKFHISQDEIENGTLIPQGGFALGNFNYRWEELAVNIVGTAVKNCETNAHPSTCYANNVLQYSIRHDGPFTVRNYLGRDYEAPIYPGRIQQAKALMAERTLTNPVSLADRGLLSDFWEQSFVGRPLEGNYTLRVYDEDGTADGVDWEKLEDIQLLMHYRFWTRLN